MCVLCIYVLIFVRIFNIESKVITFDKLPSFCPTFCPISFFSFYIVNKIFDPLSSYHPSDYMVYVVYV